MAQQHNSVTFRETRVLRGVPSWPLCTNYDIVDGNEDELHKEANEAHDNEAAGSPECHLCELCGRKERIWAEGARMGRFGAIDHDTVYIVSLVQLTMM